MKLADLEYESHSYKVMSEIGSVFYGTKRIVPAKSTFTCKACGNNIEGGDKYISTWESYIPPYHLDCYEVLVEKIFETYRKKCYDLLKTEEIQ